MPVKGWKKSWTKFKCEECNKITEDRNSNYKRRKHHFCSIECQIKWQKKAKKGVNNPHWKGGKKFWYKQISINNYPHLEHRLVMEKMIGRKLTSKELVHHIDENTKNNNPNNLLLTNRSEHRKIHK